MHLDGSNLHQVAQSLPETAWPSWSITDSPAPTATPTQAAASNGGHLARLRSRTLQQTAQTSQVIDYEYDGLFRLTSATYCPVADYATDARLYQYIYGYDLRGNRLSLDVSGSNTVASHEGFTYDLANRIISRTVSGVSDPIYYTYDVYNLTSDGQNSYSYDRANRLLSVTNPTLTTTYRYNGLGERYQQTVNANQTTTYLLDLTEDLSQVLRESTVCLFLSIELGATRSGKRGPVRIQGKDQ